MNKFLKITAAVLFFIFVAVSFLLPIETEDIWWHLKAGEYIAQNHQVPFFDPFPFSTEVTPWILTQWGGSLFYYTVHQMFGLDGLRITRVILGLLILAIFFVYSSRKIPYALSLLLTFIIFFPIESRSFLRPDFFNFIFVQIFLIALFAHRDAKDWRPLWAIPLSGILWVNIHIGSFIYGFILVGVFLLHYLIQYVQSTKAEGRQESDELFQKLEQLITVTFIYLLIFFITPYGLEGFLYPFKVFLDKDCLPFGTVSRSISELMPPINIFSVFFFWFYILAAATIIAITLCKQYRFLHTLLLALSTFMFLYSVRAGAFFALTCAYTIVSSLSQLRLKNLWPKKFARSAARVTYFIMILILILLIIRGMNTKVWRDNKIYTYHFSMKKGINNPSKAITFMKEHNIAGLVFNDMQYGGYLLWHEYPVLKPFVDSRQINPTAYLTYLSIKSRPKQVWPSVENKFGIKIALLTINRPWNIKVTQYFLNNPDWQLIFVDGNCLLFVKNGAFDLPDRLAHYRENLGQKDLLIGQINAQIPQYHFKKSFLSSVTDFFSPHYRYVDQEQSAITLFNFGFKGAALEHMAELLKVNDNIPSRKLLQRMRQNLNQQND